MGRDVPEKPGYRSLRKGRMSVPGQTYLVTTVCGARHPWFATWPAASATCAALTEPRLWRDSHLACWVLMPDHLHAIVTLGSSESLPRLLQRVKAITARATNAASGRRSGPIWTPGYHERALRRDEDLRVAARYLIANPLRAGLADAISSYPFWNAAWLEPG